MKKKKKKEDWTARIARIEDALKRVELPKEPIRLNGYEIIFDSDKFVNTCLRTVKKQNGNPYFYCILEDLEIFLKLLKN